MKKLILFISILLIGTVTYFQFFKKSSGRTSVFVEESKTRFICKASYHPSLTEKVERYLNTQTDLLLKDKAIFRINSSEGELSLKADKALNSPIAMAHIRKVCDSIPSLVNRK